MPSHYRLHVRLLLLSFNTLWHFISFTVLSFHLHLRPQLNPVQALTVSFILILSPLHHHNLKKLIKSGFFFFFFLHVKYIPPLSMHVPAPSLLDFKGCFWLLSFFFSPTRAYFWLALASVGRWRNAGSLEISSSFLIGVIPVKNLGLFAVL